MTYWRVLSLTTLWAYYLCQPECGGENPRQQKVISYEQQQKNKFLFLFKNNYGGSSVFSQGFNIGFQASAQTTNMLMPMVDGPPVHLQGFNIGFKHYALAHTTIIC
jgi:hypothetical protein